MAEREPNRPGTAIDPEAIARTLRAELRAGALGEPELTLRDEHTRLEVRLTLHTDRDAASFYARVGRRFGGFLHLAGIERVELKAAQGEVHFFAPVGDRMCHFAVTAQGQLLALGNVDEATPVRGTEGPVGE